MAFLSLKTWLRSPKDRDVIARWTPPMDTPPELRHVLVLPQPADPSRFSFLAVGDTGNADAANGSVSPQDAVAAEMARDSALPGSAGSAQLVLHLGDVVYMTGERRLYERNFLKPYAPFLTQESKIGELTFRIPFLAIPGNHDYYDINNLLKWLARIPVLGSSLRRASYELFDYSLPQGGSGMGSAFMEAFVRAPANPAETTQYEPGLNTWLPNRYYRFQFGCADFFALDSNTLDAPPPWTGDAPHERLDAKRRLKVLEKREAELAVALKREQALCDPVSIRREAEEAGQGLDPESCVRRRRLAEEALDVQRAIAQEERRLRFGPEDYDAEQIRWLTASLEQAARARPDNWRVVFLHHPLYTSIKNHCERPDVLDVRANLMELLSTHAHLVLSGHSHAFEWFRSSALPNAGIFVSGGGGQISLRPSILMPDRVGSHRAEAQALHNHSVMECAVAGRGPAATDGLAGKLYHYLRIEVTQEAIFVRPVGVRRLAGGYRREAPMAVYHCPEVGPSARMQAQTMESVEIRRGVAPCVHWASHVEESGATP
jgi:predicted phosphodiesterase